LNAQKWGSLGRAGPISKETTIKNPRHGRLSRFLIQTLTLIWLSSFLFCTLCSGPREAANRFFLIAKEEEEKLIPLSKPDLDAHPKQTGIANYPFLARVFHNFARFPVLQREDFLILDLELVSR